MLSDHALADLVVHRMGPLIIHAVSGLPLIRPGDDLTCLLIDAVDAADLQPHDQDVFVVAQKVVSKAENRFVHLSSVTPSAHALALAIEVDKDPRLVEVILSESTEVVKHCPGVLITAHRLGLVLANAGVDQSNIPCGGGEECVLLLPEDPDATCAEMKRRLDHHYAKDLGVIISDSIGRAWRNGSVGTALGAAGLPALQGLRGRRDLYDRVLEVSEVGFADQIAAAAALVMGEAAEGNAVVHIRGLEWDDETRPAAALVRAREMDLFR